jgi:hypothetical protein
LTSQRHVKTLERNALFEVEVEVEYKI